MMHTPKTALDGAPQAELVHLEGVEAVVTCEDEKGRFNANGMPGSVLGEEKSLAFAQNGGLL